MSFIMRKFKYNYTSTWVLTDATDGEAQVVHPESVDPGLVGQEAEDDTADSVGNTDHSQQQTGILFADPPFLGHSLQVNPTCVL